MKSLEISYIGYMDRIDRVALRGKILAKRLEGVVEFRVN